MRRLYTYFFFLCVPFIILRLFWKSRRLPAYRQRIAERFACPRVWPAAIDVWLHGVSFGEVVAATPLIDALLSSHYRVLVTTMTPTGSQYIQTRFKDSVAHMYVPYDLPCLVRRFFKHVQPRVGMIMETELWPHLIHQAHEFKIPLVLANARLSDKAFPQYMKTRFFFKDVLREFTTIFAQSDLDAERFLSLGAFPQQLSVAGNMKFDQKIIDHDLRELEKLREHWGVKRPVIILASTHDGEEIAWFKNIQTIQEAVPDVILLVVPRHPERFQTVYAVSQKQGLRTALRSVPSTIDALTEVVIVDSMGELLNFYRVSDYAFVGGSLVPVGGHNVLEPMAQSIPVFCGPYMNNSHDICAELSAAGALRCCHTIDEIISAMIVMSKNVSLKDMQVRAAHDVLNRNKGSMVCHLNEIKGLLG